MHYYIPATFMTSTEWQGESCSDPDQEDAFLGKRFDLPSKSQATGFKEWA